MADAALLSSFLKSVGIDAQRDGRVGVPEPLRDRHDVHAGIDELEAWRVPQTVVGDLGTTEASHEVTEGLRNRRWAG